MFIIILAALLLIATSGGLIAVVRGVEAVDSSKFGYELSIQHIVWKSTMIGL